VNTKFKIGQIWKYDTRIGEENSRLIIVNVTQHEYFGDIINIAVNGLKIESPYSEEGYMHTISHLPCTEASIIESVEELVEISNNLPDFEEGYNQWKEQFDLGKAGVFGENVKEIISIMAESFKA